MLRILVLCTGNSCRSQMAAGWLRQSHQDRAEIVSAGSQPASVVHPLAIRVMDEVGIDISHEIPQHIDRFSGQAFDRVITVCDTAAEACPVFPGKAERFHRDFTDPAKADGSEDARLTMFRRVRDEIKAWLDEIS